MDFDRHEDEQREAEMFVNRYFHSYEFDPIVSSLVHVGFSSTASQIVGQQCFNHRQRMRALEKLRESLEAAALMMRM